jgi:poly-gamma-glutamate synthesis protein (capsule biosynthesis protein)
MDVLTILLCGDVMTGRGIDQILPHPVDPGLREASVDDARTYVALAEKVNGPIPRPVDFSWPWGDALPVVEELAPDVRLINLETSITADGQFAAGKAVHYRMSPDNIGCLTVARPDVCALANNHVLDFGPGGLGDTLDALAAAGLCGVGAGRDGDESWPHGDAGRRRWPACRVLLRRDGVERGSAAVGRDRGSLGCVVHSRPVHPRRCGDRWSGVRAQAAR